MCAESYFNIIEKRLDFSYISFTICHLGTLRYPQQFSVSSEIEIPHSREIVETSEEMNHIILNKFHDVVSHRFLPNLYIQYEYTREIIYNIDGYPQMLKYNACSTQLAQLVCC